MREHIVRDDKLNPIAVERVISVKTEDGWVDMVKQYPINGYAVRGTRPTELRKRLSIIDDCPLAPSGVPGCDEMIPDYLSHRMWDTRGVNVVD